MKAARKTGEEERADERSRGIGPLDSGETRAIMLAAAALVIFLYFIKFILLPFVLAGIIAYIFTPLLDWAAEKTRWPRLLFAVAAFLVLLGIGGFVLIFAGERLTTETLGLAKDLQSLLQNFARQAIGDQPVSLFGQSVNADQIAQSALDRIRDWSGQTDQLAMIAGYSLAAIMGVFLTAVLLFYFLASGRSVARGLLWIVPPHRRRLVERIWARLDPVLIRYFIGVIAVVIYATVAAYIGLGVILGIQHAVLLALLTGILETVPVVGPTSAAVIAGLISLRTATGIMSILAYALYATLLRLSIDQLVGPVVLGRAAHVHPVLIIFCFLAGGVVLGVPGVIIAVPVALLVKSTLATLYGDKAE
ncbi:MAG TPA: AI-2E family transporter [Xanthobacteraceae bacterium]|nr:AI-2E family transporter [Xanthobacteraceae bacterium]